MPRIMVAISSRSPQAKTLLDAAAKLAAYLQADWFAVHVRQPPVLHYRAEMTEYPVPKGDLEYARSLGARVLIEQETEGNVSRTLAVLARKLSINYFVTGRSLRSQISFSWRLPLTEFIQRQLPNTIVVIV